MEEIERRMAHVIGFEAREALRGHRNHMLQENQVLLQAGGTKKKRKRVLKKPDALGNAVTSR